MKNNHFFNPTSYAGFFNAIATNSDTIKTHNTIKSTKIFYNIPKISKNLALFALIILFNYNAFTQCTGLNIGDTYGGGKVAYILQSGDPGYEAGKCKGLIAAPSDQSTDAVWGCSGTAIGSTGTALGTGQANTTAIVIGCPTAGIAAHICDTLTLGGFTDWYLPSNDELNKLYLNYIAIGNFSTTAGHYYWSSTEYISSDAYRQSFTSGTLYTGAKDGSGGVDKVRAIRSFEAPCNGISTVSDNDGNSYNVVAIGTQCWFAKNLTTTKYRTGQAIENVTDNTAWTNNTTGAYAWYNNDSTTNKATYGALYNWHAATNGSKLCPPGWKVPTDAEWTTMENYLKANSQYWCGGTSTAIAKSLATTSGWNSSGTTCAVGNDQVSNNTTGFSALPGGYRISNGTFASIGQWGYWWSSTKYNTTTAIEWYLGYASATVTRMNHDYVYGRSVRCLKDNSTFSNLNITGNLEICSGASTTLTAEPGATATYLWSPGNQTTAAITVSPSVTTTFTCYVTNGSDNDSISVVVKVNPTNTANLTSGAGSDNQTVTVGNTIDTITYATTGATNIGLATGLPAGLNYSWTSNVLTISGTPSETGTFNYSIPLTGGCGSVNATGTITVNPNPCGNTTSVTFNYNGSSVTYSTVPSAGRCWLDRNLGAAQPAISSTDNDAYGDYFQWGRGVDGHQNKYSGTTPTLSTSDDPGHGNFITSSASPYDWRNPQNDSLWQGVAGMNNPCPAGWRIPTEDEWTTEMGSWSTQDATGAFNSPLKLAVAGTRLSSSGSITAAGTDGNYWSNTRDFTLSRDLNFSSSNSHLGSNNRAHGRSVRCIKDICSVAPATPGTITGQATQTSGAIGQIYSIAPATGAYTYNWTVPTGWSINAGQGTLKITVTAGNAGQNGNITVTATNDCGNSSPASLAVTVIADPCDGETYIEDPRDNTMYNIVAIGEQCWLAENLKYIPAVVPGTTGSENIPYYYVYYYDGTSVNAAKAEQSYITYGVLYNWTAAMDGAPASTANPSGIQGACPTGWHLPSDAEWLQLVNYLGGSTIAGGKLKETGTSHWTSPNTDATNITGFTALPGGHRNNSGAFNYMPNVGYWWTSADNGTNAKYRFMNYTGATADETTATKEMGYSVRCVKGAGTCNVPTAPTNIMGEAFPCINQSSVQYSINKVANAFIYNWTFPSGWTITGNQGDTIIIVTVGTNSGNITVTAQNACGSSSSTTLAVSPLSSLTTPGSILGNNNTYPNIAQSYSVNPVPGAAYYVWSKPSGWTIIAGDSTNNITFLTSTNGGTISVYAEGPCGTSSPVNMSVNVITPCTPINTFPHTQNFDAFNPNVTDQSGNSYNTVSIGKQVWLKQNLKTTKFKDGSDILNLTDGSVWNNHTAPAYCWYDNNYSTYGAEYGALYNFYTVQTGKLCPTNWHVPALEEYTNLSNLLGGNSIAGGMLKEAGTLHWNSPNSGATNITGFYALPSGLRNNSGTFTNIYIANVSWNSNVSGVVNNAWYSSLSKDDDDIVHEDIATKGFGFSVRCVRDLPNCWVNEPGWQFGTFANGPAGSTGKYAYFDSETYTANGAGTQNAHLESSYFNFSGQTAPRISFKHYFLKNNTETVSFSYTKDDGYSWTQIQEWTATTANPEMFVQTIPALAGEPNVKFRWTYNGSGKYWSIDDFQVDFCDLTGGIVGTSQTICTNTTPAAFTNIQNPTGGGGGYTYQWQKQPDCTGGWSNLSGATASTYQHSASVTQKICFRRMVTAGTCTAYTDILTVDIIPNNTITLTSGLGSDTVEVCNGISISNITYTTTGATGANITNLPNGINGYWNNGAPYIGGAPSASGTYNYSISLTGGCGNVTANGIITVIDVPAQPGTINGLMDVPALTSGITYSITAVPGATGYTWTVPSGWAIDAGQGTTTITVTTGALGYNGNITVAASNTCGNSNVNTLAVEILPTCQVTTQPNNVAVCDGDNTSFTIAVAVAGSYQWQESTDLGNSWNDLSNGGVYSNVNNLTLNLTAVTPTMNNYMYRCVVNGACGLEVNSNTATLTVNTPPDILWQPLNTSTCNNGVLTFTVDATGGSLTYQWQMNDGGGWTNLSNNSPYSNVTTSVLSINPAISAMDGYQYRVEVTGVCSPNIVTSLAATLTIGSYNAITLSSAPGTNAQETCLNEDIIPITYDVIGASSATYTGLPNGVTGNLVSNTIIISGAPTASGVFNYTINLVGGCGTATESGSITVKSLPTKPFIQTAINNQETSFTAKWNASAGGADGYYLDVSANSSFTSILPGYDNLDVGNVTTYSVTGLVCNTTYFYRVRAIKNACFSDYSYTMSASTIACSCPNVGEAYDGGIVAYLLQPGDPGYVLGQCAAIIATAADLPLAAWGCEGTPITTSDDLGEGYNNTSAIVLGCATPSIAAKAADDLVLNSYDDWFLPSKAELEKLYINRATIGGFSSAEYWTSSQVDDNLAYTLDFSTGQFASAVKSNSKLVRPVRYLIPPVVQLVTDTVCYQDSIIYKIPPVPGATSYTWEFTGPYDELNEMGTMCNLIPLNDGVLSVTAHNECGPSTTRVLEVIVYHYGALEWNGVVDNNWFNAENWNPPVSSKSTLNCPIRIPGPSTYVQLETDAPHQPVIDFALAGTDKAECQSILIRDNDILTMKNDDMLSMNTLEVNGHIGISGTIIFENDMNRILLKSDTGQIQFNVSALKSSGEMCRTCKFVLEDGAKYSITEDDAEANSIILEGTAELTLTEDLQLFVKDFDLSDALSSFIMEDNTTLYIAGEISNLGTLDLTNGTVYYNSGNDIWVDEGYQSQTIIPATYNNLKANGGNYSDGKTLTIGDGSGDVVCTNLQLLNMDYPTKVQTNIDSDIQFADGGTFSFAADPDSSYMILDVNSRFYAPDLNTEFVMGDVDPDFNNNVINIYYSHATNKAIKLKDEPIEFYGTVNYKGTGKQIIVDNSYKNLVLDAHEDCIVEIHDDDADLFVNEYLNLKSGQLNLNTNKLTITTYNNFAVSYNIGYIYAETTPVINFDNKVQWNIGSAVQSSGKSYEVPFGEDKETILPFKFEVVENDMTELDGYIQFSTYKTAQPNTPYPTAIPHLGEYDNGGGVYDRYWYFNYFVDDDKVSHAGSPVEGYLSLSFINDITNLDGILVPDMIAQRFNAHDEVWADVLYTQNSTTSMPVYGGSTITNVTPGGEVKAFNTSYIDETQFYNVWVLSSTQSILPITLLEFAAECQTDKVELKWSTATETNADFFTVERSSDGVTWSEVGTIQAAGTSSVQHNYSLIDNYPLDGIAYYRLSQTDFNGIVKIAKIIVANCVINKPTLLSIYPNPFTETLQVNFINVNGDNAQFAIFDALGQLVIQKEITKVEIEQGYIVLDLKNLANAIYYIQFTTQDLTIIEKIVKQK